MEPAAYPPWWNSTRKATTLAKRDARSLAQAIRLDDLKRSGGPLANGPSARGEALLPCWNVKRSRPWRLVPPWNNSAGALTESLAMLTCRCQWLLQNDTKLAYSVDLSKVKLTDPDSVSRLQAVGLDVNAVTDLAAHRVNGAFRLDVTTDLPVDDPVTDSFPWGDSRRITRETTEYHPGQAALMAGGGLLVLLGLVGFGRATTTPAVLRQRREGRGPQRRSIT